jgi:hypothetical protein
VRRYLLLQYHLGPELRHIPFPDVRPDDLDPEPVGCSPRALMTTSPEAQGATASGVRHELPDGAGLADAWLTNQHHQASPAGQRVLQGGL